MYAIRSYYEILEYLYEEAFDNIKDSYDWFDDQTYYFEYRGKLYDNDDIYDMIQEKKITKLRKMLNDSIFIQWTNDYETNVYLKPNLTESDKRKIDYLIGNYIICP